MKGWIDMKPKQLTEFFKEYMNEIAMICDSTNTKNIEKRLIDCTWEHQKNIVKFENEIDDQVLGDEVIFGDYSFVYVLCYEIKNRISQFMRDRNEDDDIKEGVSSIYHTILDKIKKNVNFETATKEELLRFGFCETTYSKETEEDIFLIPYYILPIIPKDLVIDKREQYGNDLVFGCISCEIHL